MQLIAYNQAISEDTVFCGLAYCFCRHPEGLIPEYFQAVNTFWRLKARISWKCIRFQTACGGTYADLFFFKRNGQIVNCFIFYIDCPFFSIS